jgi:hypothetical protein
MSQKQEEVKREKWKGRRQEGKGEGMKGNGGIAGGAGKRKGKTFGTWYTVNKYL